jgi:hypothetical protein
VLKDRQDIQAMLQWAKANGRELVTEMRVRDDIPFYLQVCDHN